MPLKIRKIRIEGDVAYIPLTKGYEAIIDATRVSLVRHWKWHFANGYALRRQMMPNSKKVVHLYLHRVIAMPPIGLVVDHINGNKLDCRIANLRPCTNTQNIQNQKISKNNTTGFKGVVRRGERYETAIRAHGRRVYLGVYDTPEEAHAAYCKASAKFHGEFGRTE